MSVSKTIFREYDVRGLVDRELTPELARALGRAYATVAWRVVGRAPVLAVGRDNRPSSAALACGVRDGIEATGATVVDVGELPTPALYFAVEQLKTDGGLQVTGSHNPPEFNGFKMVVAGDAIHGDGILELYDIIVAERWTSGAGKQRAEGSVLPAYREAIVARNRLARPVHVVVDCGNGVASLIAISTLEALGAEVTPLFCESDGRFPNHHPDPTVPENLNDLRRVVRTTQAELGLAFDGDGDRIGAVDENGAILFGDQLLIVFGRDAVRRFGPGVPVIFDVKCSELLPQALAAAGARPVMWKTGHSLIKARMKELQAPLAGEMSGHLFFGGDWFGFDDALFAAARLLEIVSAGPPGLARLLADLPRTFATPELRVACPDELKFSLVEQAAAHFASRYSVNTIDGVRIAFADGWGLLRASNTQPVLVLRFEATSPEALARYRAEVTGWLVAHGVTV
ncbi:MAG TPA: phosphomannomutase/phosphoglucomutase [Gemmatimonadales bacterium]|jgi:phosphomannomutase/phosphoglucomutase|nr:phosphomannomutase/phosphoglucomutase [Gemmatimonadales bacterium]